MYTRTARVVANNGQTEPSSGEISCPGQRNRRLQEYINSDVHARQDFPVRFNWLNGEQETKEKASTEMQTRSEGS